MGFSTPTYGAAVSKVKGVASGLVSATLNADKTEFTYTYADGTVLTVPVTQPPLDVELVKSETDRATEAWLIENKADIKGDKGDGVQILSEEETESDILDTTVLAVTFANSKTDTSYYSRTQSDLHFIATDKLGARNGVATLDSNGHLMWSQIPTSLYYIAGAIDAENVHTLPDSSMHTDGAQVIITNAGYIEQNASMTLEKGRLLTEFEVYSAMKLITSGYSFTLKSGNTTLGIIASLESDKITLNTGDVINLPYAEDIVAVSTPSTVQIPCVSGDVFMLIDGHWQHMSNATYVTSVNEQMGAVVITAESLGTSKQWYGTQEEYDALETYDENTDYNIYEE